MSIKTKFIPVAIVAALVGALSTMGGCSTLNVFSTTSQEPISLKQKLSSKTMNVAPGVPLASIVRHLEARGFNVVVDRRISQNTLFYSGPLLVQEDLLRVLEITAGRMVIDFALIGNDTIGIGPASFHPIHIPMAVNNQDWDVYVESVNLLTQFYHRDEKGNVKKYDIGRVLDDKVSNRIMLLAPSTIRQKAVELVSTINKDVLNGTTDGVFGSEKAN